MKSAICYLFLRLGNYPLARKIFTKFLKIARGRAGMVYLNSKKIIRIKKQNTKICRCRRKHSKSARDVKFFCPKCNTFTVYSSEMIKSKLHAVLFRNDQIYPMEGGVSNSIFHVSFAAQKCKIFASLTVCVEVCGAKTREFCVADGLRGVLRRENA